MDSFLYFSQSDAKLMIQDHISRKKHSKIKLKHFKSNIYLIS